MTSTVSNTCSTIRDGRALLFIVSRMLIAPLLQTLKTANRMTDVGVSENIVVILSTSTSTLCCSRDPFGNGTKQHCR